MELGDVSLQCDATQPAKQAQGEMAHGRSDVAQHNPQGDGDPRSVGVDTVVLTLRQQVDELVPRRKQGKGHCKDIIQFQNQVPPGVNGQNVRDQTSRQKLLQQGFQAESLKPLLQLSAVDYTGHFNMA